MRSIVRAAGGTAVLVALAGACTAGDILGPEPIDGGLRQGQVQVSLTVDPQTIDPPGTVLATLTYENLGTETVVITSAYGCLSFASVYRGHTRVPFPATDYGCTAAFSTRELRPGSPLTMEWPLVIGGEDGFYEPPGTYRFVAQLNTHSPDLERSFVIR